MGKKPSGNNRTPSAPTGEELERRLSASGAEWISQDGSHSKWRLPDGSIFLNTRHNSQLGFGLWHKMWKQLIKAGLTLMVLALLAWVLL